MQAPNGQGRERHMPPPMFLCMCSIGVSGHVSLFFWRFSFFFFFVLFACVFFFVRALRGFQNAMQNERRGESPYLECASVSLRLLWYRMDGGGWRWW